MIWGTFKELLCRQTMLNTIPRSLPDHCAGCNF